MPLFDSLQNQGEYLASHYFAEQLAEDLKKGRFKDWTSRETDPVEGPHRLTPRTALPGLRAQYFTEDARTLFAERAALEEKEGQSVYTHGDPEWRAQLTAWHRKVLTALGFDTRVEPGENGTALREITVHRGGRDTTVPVAYYGEDIAALDCGWTDTFDGVLAKDGPARLLYPVKVTSSEQYSDGAALASFLLHADEIDGVARPPRFVLLLLGGVVLLADRRGFGEGRYIAANLDAALGRADVAKTGELATIAALLCHEMLAPRENGEGPALDELLAASTHNATGVTDELRDGLRTSVELIANEVLRRLEEQGVTPEQLAEPRAFARRLTRESLRYLYRILFLLYAESRPELGILPADDGAYEAGYSILRLRELVQRDTRLTDEQSRNGTHLYESLELLFRLVNKGHRAHGTEDDDDLPADSLEVRAAKAARRSEDRGLRFEQLNSTLFDETAITLIGRNILHPDAEEGDSAAEAHLDTRLRNDTLHRVLRALTLTSGSRKQRGGFISYRNLGINQLGAVYEGLMSYTGSIATEKLYEVAKKGDAKDGSWMVPASRIDQYPDEVFVRYPAGDPEGRAGQRRTYEKGRFVYRLSGRDRQTSASYYTPESLTKLTVELTLRERVDQDKDETGNVRTRTRAAEILQYKICEPALGSGAFLNEAINQVAAEYLKRRQEELGVSIPASEYPTELQRAKAYIALHNCYGVDLNATAVELAEVSLWLNTMHPGMRAPWFGLHLRRGNSLIGARHAFYAAKDVAGREWFASKNTLAPTELPLTFRSEPDREEELELPQGAVHQFLLPAHGWAAVASDTEVKKFDPVQAKQLADWRKGMLKTPTKAQVARLQSVARRAEYLWGLVVKRIELSEKQIARKVDVWGACGADGKPLPEYKFMERPDKPIDREQIHSDLFKAVDTPYWRLKKVMDAWCALWFWPIDGAGLLDGTDDAYVGPSGAELVQSVIRGLQGDVGGEAAGTGGDGAADGERAAEAGAAAETTVKKARAWSVAEQGALFGEMQGTIMSVMDSDEEFMTLLDTAPKSKPKSARTPKPKPVRRPLIPLKDLADWIDFAEALLGTVDIDPESLVGSFPSLPELSNYELELPKNMGMDLSDKIQERFPWLHAVEDIAEEQGFFHWQLEFAYTFARSGGFDLQVGNPPWVRPEWLEDPVLAEFDPWFCLTDKSSVEARNARRVAALDAPAAMAYWHKERRTTKAVSDFFTSRAVYMLLAGTQPDLYRCFMIRAWANCSMPGTAGLIHPDSHFTGKREGSLRAATYQALRFHAHFANERKIFADIDYRVTFGLHVYGHARPPKFTHASWLFEPESLRASLVHDGVGELPGIKHRGTWDIRAHRDRLVEVGGNVLTQWAKLVGATDVPALEGTLLYPVTRAEVGAIAALAKIELRQGAYEGWISRGFDEKNDRDKGYFEERSSVVDSWNDVILQGPHFSVATPLNKNPRIPCKSNKDYDPVDLTIAGDDMIPHTNYRRPEALTYETFRAAQDSRKGIWHVDNYRLAWREMIAQSGVRSLHAALMPPGPAHVHTVRTMVVDSPRRLVLTAGMFAALPVDYYLRITDCGHLDVANAKLLPAPHPGHPLARALTLRAARLNCVTNAYAQLWSEAFEDEWREERWAADWDFDDDRQLGTVPSTWRRDCALRTEYERRAALVEIDALVAVWFGITVEQFMAIFLGRFGILASYEADMYFDAEGRQITREYYGQGIAQRSDTYKSLKEHLRDPQNNPVPEGYTAPFYRADREREMREAHAVFQARLDAAVAAGKWDPVKQEVPSS